MSDTFVNVNIVLEQTSNKSIHVPCTAKTTAEDVCIQICKTLGIGTLTRHLFALRITGQKYFLMSSATFKEKSNAVDFRIRFKPANIHRLIKIDSKAYDYYFHQARTDVLENKVPDLVYEKCRKELVGLGITDMYRVMLEKDIPRETVETEYKKYIPKEVIKRHQFFIKKPIHDTLGKLQKSGYDAPYVKAEYIKQLDIIAPEYLSEVYKAVIDENGCICNIIIRISPYHPTEPGVKYCYDSKKEKWYVICTIEELGFISIRNDGTVELSRKNGIPFYLKFNSIIAMNSFISALDGYYRLTCKWTFNICKDVNTPSLQKLFQMRCHGPVGGEFSYAKLEEKRNNKPGCFIIRESESKYTDYFIDVCVKDSSKPKTFKLEKICTDEFIFNDDVTRYKSISQLISAYSDPNGSIYLQECLPPSEYDVSPLLLCRSDNIVGDSLTDSSALNDQMPSTPLCINWKDLQVYKGRKCLKWNKLRKKVKKNDTLVVIEKYPKTNFPEHDLGKAKKYCRNPNSNIGGPWCFTENSETSQVEMEYCDIPLCDDVDCLVFTNNNDIYMHYSSFDKGIDNITFSLKLWDPDSFLKASARIVLSTLALPLSGEDIQNAGIGIEIYLSNDYSALTFGNADSTFEEIKTLGILKSTNFTPFSLMWHKGFIELRVDGQKDPIFLMEYKKKKNLVEYKKHKFQYYSITGTNVLWSFPFCIMDKVCDIHTTTGSLFQQFYQLQETETGYDLLLHVRAFHSATILLTPTPAYPYPNIKIIFMNLIDKHSRILVEPYPGSPIEVIIEHELPNLVSYWKWRQFHITIFGSKIQVYVKKSTGNHEIFDVNHPYIRLVRWFSVSSDDTVAHWSFYCKPPDFFVPPPALLPECAISSEELDYEGTQDVTSDGLPCLPWSSKNLLPSEVKSMFSENVTTRDAVNYCRDPLKLGQGTFCYAKSLKSKIHVQKSFCHIRKCKSELCKLAGTGNDFMGVITTTRSNRSCDVWKLSEWENTNRHVWNDTLFPDIKSGNAKNHCRNPSRNIAGAWCYTTDPDILIDACSVKDCDKPEECTVISTTTHKGQKKEGLRGITMVYRSMWKITKGKKIEVAMKILKPESSERFLKDFLAIAGQWAFLQSSAIVRLYGITLTSNISFVLEYFRLGPLDQYLRENRKKLKQVDLIEAASNLAVALWHLKENDIVHGNIRCRKLMVSSHDENSFTVKLTDPGIHSSYPVTDVHWMPIECYGNFDFAKRSPAADVWAFATTMWEIFTFGEELSLQDHIQSKMMYASGKRLPQPAICPPEIYNLLKECWDADPHRRKQPQAIMRDVNQLLYQVYNSRRVHSYAKVYNKGSLHNAAGASTQSLISSKTDSTFVGYSADLVPANDVGSICSGSSFNDKTSPTWPNDPQRLANYHDMMSSDFSTLFNFNLSTATTSLDSLCSMQSAFELDEECHVVLQGRIGQGFYGEVYRGTLEYISKDFEPRKVAVKKLKSSAHSSSLQDFEREINIMKDLKHPNIVEILGVFREEEISLVMEFVEHGALQSYLKIHKDLNNKQRLKYALDITKGMEYLGKKNIVHRDLAARNILVDDKNHVKISDFGLAQVLGANEYYILKTNRELPFKWYAPESLRDGKFSIRSDVWSYGVTMCELFNFGEEPQLTNANDLHDEGPEQEVLLKALEKGSRFPCPSSCPQMVYIRIIYPCWNSNPHERPDFGRLRTETEDILTQY